MLNQEAKKEANKMLKGTAIILGILVPLIYGIIELITWLDKTIESPITKNVLILLSIVVLILGAVWGVSYFAALSVIEDDMP